MQALKALVIGMGILILLGTAVVIVTLVSRVGGVEDKGFGTLYLDLPESCRIAAVTAMEGRAVLRLSGPAKDGCGRLVVVDPLEGSVLGRIEPGAAPSVPGGDD
ncbi:hypothetical protein [Ferruginivarius sediminum]|uniref:Uncharacterized protein n=1 Tax=Ferruginivarius sediminum TaxID=2661937 RepID=A0A369T9H9_9PROT|nr:hypothetical protein [Ferruginivarius sediminum]RDD61950.1 hypothetical protein DRB17_10725 [Ferruginivarius sediminum]